MKYLHVVEKVNVRSHTNRVTAGEIYEVWWPI